LKNYSKIGKTSQCIAKLFRSLKFKTIQTFLIITLEQSRI